eukprot:CAMPEP_0118923510 /NCGR_PEP_ID=MMETSP1169-20130426/2002_1 /TAXON_ID=36882 /ORGANISM="Pyramimonas obovata, Strain CCMP722" /LENGTH=210 /DNA_ID=CAMNT_0006864499 /DNA_START=79 /DNA_END=711 /DNA_ORIENTATION=-
MSRPSWQKNKVVLHERHRVARKASLDRRVVVCQAVQPSAKLSGNGRRAFCLSALVSPLIAAKTSIAQDCTADSTCSKLVNLSPEEIKAIVKADLVERQFLATANFTQAIYADDCTFTDEISTYSFKEFVKGTAQLFDASRSTVALVGDVEADEKTVTFRFSEELCFNVPFKPKTYLSGKLVLTRNSDGLISNYKETWDQPVNKVLSTVHF